MPEFGRQVNASSDPATGSLSIDRFHPASETHQTGLLQRKRAHGSQVCKEAVRLPDQGDHQRNTNG